MNTPTRWTHYERALKNLGYDIPDSTIGNIPEEHAAEPAPNRGKKTTWKEFLWEIEAS